MTGSRKRKGRKPAGSPGKTAKVQGGKDGDSKINTSHIIEDTETSTHPGGEGKAGTVP